MNEVIILIFIIFVAAILEACVFTALKKFKGSKKLYLFLIAILLYGFICVIIVYSLNFQKKIALVNALWNGFSIVLVALAGYFIFKDELTKKEILAIILIVIATVLIFMDSK